MTKPVHCTVTISEVDGKLSIFAKIPPGAEKTIAGALAEMMIGQSAVMMNELLGKSEQVDRVTSN